MSLPIQTMNKSMYAVFFTQQLLLLLSNIVCGNADTRTFVDMSTNAIFRIVTNNPKLLEYINNCNITALGLEWSDSTKPNGNLIEKGCDVFDHPGQSIFISYSVEPLDPPSGTGQKLTHELNRVCYPPGPPLDPTSATAIFLYVLAGLAGLFFISVVGSMVYNSLCLIRAKMAENERITNRNNQEMVRFFESRTQLSSYHTLSDSSDHNRTLEI